VLPRLTLRLIILLPQPPGCQNYRRALLHLAKTIATVIVEILYWISFQFFLYIRTLLKIESRAGGVAQGVDCLPSKYKSLGLPPH
jgi:hypothetical protein